MPLSKRTVTIEPGALIPAAQGGDFASLYPTLWEYLSSTQWSEGGARQTSTLLLLCEDGDTKLCLNDRAGNRSRWTTGETLQVALGDLEQALRDDEGGWRRYKPFKRRD